MVRLSNEACKRKCGKRERIYVAVSEDLNAPSFSQNRPWRGFYVIKVGSTQACHDRENSLNRHIARQPRYAGVSDWRVVQCWDSSVTRQDEKRFRPWAKRHIRYFRPVPDISGVRRKDLYGLSPQQVARGVWEPSTDRLNDEIVAVAIRHLQSLIESGKLADLSGKQERAS